MPSPEPRRIRIETANYIIRTVEPGDATERWCNWPLDPETARQLNRKAAPMTMPQLQAYIARFDNVTSFLLGIFEKTSDRLVGIRSIYVDHTRREFLDNILIGEPDARGRTARSESTDAVLPVFFDEMDLATSRCGIMADNDRMLAVVVRKGWVLEGTQMNPAADGGPPRKLHHFRLDRETWRAKMRERAATRA